MRRLLVNDCLNTLGEHTFWMDLREWFHLEFIGGEFSTLPQVCDSAVFDLIIRNASYFSPIKTDVPQIALLQDIFENGQQGHLRKMQEDVIASCATVVFNSEFTASHYPTSGLNQHVRKMLDESTDDIIIVSDRGPVDRVIPLPVDFSTFELRNSMGYQQALSLPSGCVCWVGACAGPAGHVKGFDLFIAIVRLNPDIPFVAVFKDELPPSFPPNMRCYARVTHEDLCGIMNACRVGLCTSRIESQHLAGIEMGACGLPLVVPNTGTYWNRVNWPGATVLEPNPATYTNAIRELLSKPEIDREVIRDFWKREFSKEVVRAQWEALVSEVENGNP